MEIRTIRATYLLWGIHPRRFAGNGCAGVKLPNPFVDNALVCHQATWHGVGRCYTERILGSLNITDEVKVLHTLRTRAWLIAGSIMLWAVQPLAVAAVDIKGVTAVSSRVSGDYIRAKLPDGTFRTETYVIGRGGFLGSGAKGVPMANFMRDDTIDDMTVHAIAQTLKRQSSSSWFIGEPPQFRIGRR